MLLIGMFVVGILCLDSLLLFLLIKKENKNRQNFCRLGKNKIVKQSCMNKVYHL